MEEIKNTGGIIEEIKNTVGIIEEISWDYKVKTTGLLNKKF